MSEAIARPVEVEITEEMLDGIVQLRVANVPDWQIAEGFGIHADVFAQLLETEEYKIAFSKNFQKQIADAQTTNNGWDGLEELSIRKLQQAMKNAVDPEFALKVARVANGATRRNITNNKPIDSGHGGTAVIYISNNFVDKLQRMEINPRSHDNDGGDKKQNDFVDPDKVENILLGKRVEDKALDMEFEDLISEPMRAITGEAD